MKTITRCALTGAALIALATGAQAATLLKMQDGSGQTTDMWIKESAARIEPPEPGVYMLMDLEDGSMRMVNDNQKQALETGSLSDGSGARPDIDLAFDRAGSGPEIAGYDTQHYVLKVSGETCQHYYLSEDAVDDNDLEPFMEQMARLSEKGSGMENTLNECDLASRQVGGRLADLGLPLRVTDAEGATESEVLEIRANADAGDRSFEVPEGYQVVNLGDMMRQHMERIERQRQQSQ